MEKLHPIRDVLTQRLQGYRQQADWHLAQATEFETRAANHRKQHEAFVHFAQEDEALINAIQEEPLPPNRQQRRSVARKRGKARTEPPNLAGAEPPNSGDIAKA